MGGQQYGAVSVRQLAAYVDRVAPRDPVRWEAREPVPGAAGLPVRVSRERGRQLWMVVGMFDRAVGREEMPVRSRKSAAQLFTWAALRAFWELAVDGELYARAADLGERMPLASQRVVRDCLELLASIVVPGKVVRLPVVVSPAPRAVTTPSQEAELFRFLVGMAADAGGIPAVAGQSRQVAQDYRTRLLAKTGVVLDTRSRSGELAGMREADLDASLHSVRVVRHQQNGRHLEPLEVVLPLSEGTRVALRRWLRVRERLVRGVEGSVDALWVSVAANNKGQPPGLPVSPQSLRAAYARGVRALNAEMAGRPGWQPLPTRLEGLRRAWEPPEEQRLREAAVAESAPEPRPVGRPMLPAGRPVPHGRESTYNRGWCRCGECREAASNARAARRAAARERGTRRSRGAGRAAGRAAGGS
ncbi:hypothetical protein [Streptomyces sp. NPDC018584]|uniref:hypothetical protein n=1 Tax=unclassified Streptomyces TaxID=2593676 RepID=UPI0037A0DDF6